MKPTACLIAITGIAAVVYLGYSVGRAARSFERPVKTALSESKDWRAAIGQLPSTARATSQQAIKGGAQQLDKEIVGAPAEMVKATVNNLKKIAAKVVPKLPPVVPKGKLRVKLP